MKTKQGWTVLFVVINLFAFVQSFATEPSGIRFFKGSWQEALALAQAENKVIFVDFYADWCGPCKWMAKEVFTDAEVGDYFNEHMINIQINAEKQERDLVKKMALDAYPTLAVFDPSGDMMSRQVGALEKAKLLDFVKSSTSFETVYQNYTKDATNFEKINAYLVAQEFKDKSKLDSVSTSILNSLSSEQLQTREAWNILVKYSGDYNSRAFEFVTKNAMLYYSNISEPDEFQNGYSWFINAMLTKAAEAKDLVLVEKAASYFLTMRKSCKTMSKPEAYYREAIKISYLALAEDSTYQLRLVKFVNTHHGNDWRKLASNARLLLGNNPNDPQVKQAALRMAAKALAINNNIYTNWTIAIARQVEGKPAEAKRFTLIAIQMAKPDQVQLNIDGTITLDTQELGDTVVSIPLRVK